MVMNVVNHRLRGMHSLQGLQGRATLEIGDQEMGGGGEKDRLGIAGATERRWRWETRRWGGE